MTVQLYSNLTSLNTTVIDQPQFLLQVIFVSHNLQLITSWTIEKKTLKLLMHNYTTVEVLTDDIIEIQHSNSNSSDSSYLPKKYH